MLMVGDIRSEREEAGDEEEKGGWEIFGSSVSVFYQWNEQGSGKKKKWKNL